MKLNITPQELEDGFMFKRIGEKKLPDWQAIARQKQPMALSRPVSYNGKTYRLAVITELEPDPERGYKISFNPVWGRAYRGCHVRSSNVRIIVCEFESVKLQFDDTGHSPSSFTTNGPGVGREAEEDAERLLPELRRNSISGSP